MRLMGYKRARRQFKGTRKPDRVVSYATIGSYRGLIFDKAATVARYADGRYGCTCISKLFRRRAHCKHIRRFQEHEKTICGY